MRRQRRSFALDAFLIITLIFTLNTQTIAYSVYSIPNQHDDRLNVYDTLEDGSLDYRATYDLRYIRPVDVTIDKKSNTLFVTSEFQNDIELINAWTFLSEGIVTADGASDLAGIVEDEEKGLDLRISSCYNKFILLSARMLGIRETFESERSES